MSKNSDALIRSGIALIALMFIIIIYTEYNGHADLAANMFFHGTVILIGFLGFLLVCIGGAIGSESTVGKTFFVLGSVLCGYITFSIIRGLMEML